MEVLTDLYIAYLFPFKCFSLKATTEQKDNGTDALHQAAQHHMDQV